MMYFTLYSDSISCLLIFILKKQTEDVSSNSFIWAFTFLVCGDFSVTIWTWIILNCILITFDPNQFSWMVMSLPYLEKLPLIEVYIKLRISLAVRKLIHFSGISSYWCQHPMWIWDLYMKQCLYFKYNWEILWPYADVIKYNKEYIRKPALQLCVCVFLELFKES